MKVKMKGALYKTSVKTSMGLRREREHCSRKTSDKWSIEFMSMLELCEDLKEHNAMDLLKVEPSYAVFMTAREHSF